MEDFDYFFDILTEDETVNDKKAIQLSKEMCSIVDENPKYKTFWIKSKKFQIGVKPIGKLKKCVEKQVITDDKDVVTIGFIF